jgi:signal transduction histidine kinase
MAAAISLEPELVVTRAHPGLVALPDARRGDDAREQSTGSAAGLVVAMPDGHADATIRALVAAHEQERRRIARDLHDVIGQALTAVKLNLETLRRDLPGQRNDADLRRSIAIVDEAMRDIRDVAIDLRPAILDDLGLAAAARWYLSRQGRLAGYRTSFAADPIPFDLDDEVESACFRVLQEALTNVARHARPTRVRVELRRTPDDILLVVEDDGVGFEVLRTRRRQGRRPTLGLTGMSERACSIGGSIDISSTPGVGTRIRARFPRAVANDQAGEG